jgi:outer membrane lipoprotein-sorting protein
MVMRSALLFVGLFVSSAVQADDAADAKAIVERAIKARGDKPGAVPGVTTWKEKIALEAFDQKIDLDTEWTVQPPDKMRIQMTVAVAGQNLDLVVVVNGEKVWYLVNGQIQESDGSNLAEALTEMNRMWASSLTPLLTEEFKLATAKEKVVNGKPAAGVAVRNGKRPVVTLYFDKETGLLVKREATVKDSNTDGKEVLEEVVLSDYKEADGRKYHTKVVVTRDDKPFYRSEVSKPKLVEKPDPKLFEKP